MGHDRKSRLSWWAVLIKTLRSASLNAQKHCPPYPKDLCLLPAACRYTEFKLARALRRSMSGFIRRRAEAGKRWFQSSSDISAKLPSLGAMFQG